MEEIKTKKPDRRIIKTKKAICNALVALMSKKEIDQITIKEIADTADVNRKTVYNYYSSCNDILLEIESSIMKNYEKALNSLDLTSNYENTYKVFCTLGEIMKDDFNLYSHILSMNKNTNIVRLLTNYFITRLKDNFIEQKCLKDDSLAEVLATYIVSGMMATYQYWFKNSQNITLEEFSSNIHALTSNGMSTFLK